VGIKIVNTFLRKAVHVSLARVLGTIATAVAGIWAARCLGPKNLGISTLVMVTVGQVALMMGVFPDPMLVRQYKTVGSVSGQQQIYTTVLLVRLGLATIAALIGVVCISLGLLPSSYTLAASVGLVLLYFRALSSNWLYQAMEKMQYLAWLELAGACSIALAYAIWMRPGAGAGMDIFIQTAVGVVVIIFLIVNANRLAGFRAIKLELCGREIVALFWEGRWLLLMQLAIYIYASFEVALLGYIAGAELAGKYRTAQTWMQASSVLISLAPLLLFPRFVEWRKISKAVLWDRQKKIAQAAVIVALAGSFLSLWLIPIVHPVFFGAQYSDAAYPGAILLISKLVVLVNGVFAWGLVADGNSDKKIALTMSSAAIFSLGVNVFVIPRFGMMGAACVNVLSEIYILIIVFIFSRNNNDK